MYRKIISITFIQNKKRIFVSHWLKKFENFGIGQKIHIVYWPSCAMHEVLKREAIKKVKLW